MKKSIFKALAFIMLTSSVFATEGKKEIETKEVSKSSEQVLGRCNYSIFVMDRDGNYTGVMKTDTVYATDATDCLGIVASVANALQAQYPDCTLRIYNDFE